MARARQTITISLPEEMFAEVHRVSREERRTHSGLVREALHRYFHDRFPVAPTQGELRAAARGRAEIAKGQYLTLDQFLHAVDTKNRKARGKGATKTSRA
jgi:predicted transcriptional regulator